MGKEELPRVGTYLLSRILFWGQKLPHLQGPRVKQRPGCKGLCFGLLGLSVTEHLLCASNHASASQMLSFLFSALLSPRTIPIFTWVLTHSTGSQRTPGHWPPTPLHPQTCPLLWEGPWLSPGETSLPTHGRSLPQPPLTAHTGPGSLGPLHLSPPPSPDHCSTDHHLTDLLFQGLCNLY